MLSLHWNTNLDSAVEQLGFAAADAVVVHLEGVGDAAAVVAVVVDAAAAMGLDKKLNTWT